MTGIANLLPEVPSPSYRIRARMHRDKQLTNAAQCGIYCQQKTVVSSQGPQHYFNAAYFSGVNVMQQPRPDLWTIDVSLIPRLYTDLLYPTKGPHRDWHGISVSAPFAREIKMAPGLGLPWTEIEITVRGNLLKGKCRIDDGLHEADESIGEITPRDQVESKMALPWTFPDLAGVQPEQFDGTALGIYVSAAALTVKSFVVETISDP